MEAALEELRSAPLKEEEGEEKVEVAEEVEDARARAAVWSLQEEAEAHVQPSREQGRGWLSRLELQQRGQDMPRHDLKCHNVIISRHIIS